MGKRKIPKPPPPGQVNSAGAAEVLGVSEATFYRYRREDDFPAPAQQGNRGKRTLYRVADLLAWKEARERAAGQHNE